MKEITKIIIGIMMVCLLAGTTMAVDINALDQVSVLMTKSKVLSLLGMPDDVGEAGNGLEVDIYRVNNISPMVGAGCIYEDNQRLAGQAFIFQGEMGKEAAERLKKHGFTVTEEKEGAFRLLGKDDDTGQPLVAYITLNNGMTVIMTFEKDFYDRRVK
ncbi:MAG: hypothetical protein NTX75_04860 [Proteobacteria bacterium]|nr:hypothetical protein [Pseudomonadota bacterium]